MSSRQGGSSCPQDDGSFPPAGGANIGGEAAVSNALRTTRSTLSAKSDYLARRMLVICQPEHLGQSNLLRALARLYLAVDKREGEGPVNGKWNVICGLRAPAAV